jgi:hypothetical protein
VERAVLAQEGASDVSVFYRGEYSNAVLTEFIIQTDQGDSARDELAEDIRGQLAKPSAAVS